MTNFVPSGQGGYLLPPGYLSTKGSQLIDSNGDNVRIAAIGLDGTLLANGAANGLSRMTLAAIIANMKADGFNTIRMPWNDAMLTGNTMPAAGLINYTLNPSLKGLTSMEVLVAVVEAASTAGMKVILDHHNNEGKQSAIPTNSTNQGHQANGLWFDSGPGTDGTDGAGNPGTVTATQFEVDWVVMAHFFAGNSTVIGFDLDNEPGYPSTAVNWGQGGPTDWWATATAVGNAIQAVDPGVLIIVEGPETIGPGNGMTATAPDGDLSAVKAMPVVLNIPNKVVYSVHEYPPDITGRPLPSDWVGEMKAAWGYLVNQNIAPVWIGEMGASMNDLSDMQWALMLLSYMNGGFAPIGGPTVAAGQQPVSGCWWPWGSGNDPDDGTLEPDWKTYRPEVQGITNQLLFK